MRRKKIYGEAILFETDYVAFPIDSPDANLIAYDMILCETKPWHFVRCSRYS